MRSKDGLDNETYMWINPHTMKPLSYSYMYKRLQRIVKRMNQSRKLAGKALFSAPHHPHRMRHSGCKYYTDLGYTTEMLRAILGHSEYSNVTAHYANPNFETLKKAAESKRKKPSKEELISMAKLQGEIDNYKKEMVKQKEDMQAQINELNKQFARINLKPVLEKHR